MDLYQYCKVPWLGMTSARNFWEPSMACLYSMPSMCMNMSDSSSGAFLLFSHLEICLQKDLSIAFVVEYPWNPSWVVGGHLLWCYLAVVLLVGYWFCCGCEWKVHLLVMPWPHLWGCWRLPHHSLGLPSISTGSLLLCCKQQKSIQKLYYK